MKYSSNINNLVSFVLTNLSVGKDGYLMFISGMIEKNMLVNLIIFLNSRFRRIYPFAKISQR